MIHILVTDDNEQNLYMLKVLLEGNGYSVDSACNGEDALECARRQAPDLILTDILMPVMDGFTLCRQWKADDKLKHIPLVFYTATYTDPKDETFALSLGADRFVIKPQEIEALVEIIRTVLDEHKSEANKTQEIVADEDDVYLKQYNAALIRKLEDKMLQLELKSKELEQQVSRTEEACETLRLSEERFRNIFEQFSDGVFVHDLDGNLLDVNEKTLTIFGNKGKKCSHEKSMTS